MRHYLLIIFVILSFSSSINAQCDPDLQWTDFKPNLPQNVYSGRFADVYNNELYVLARLDNNPVITQWEILKLDTLLNTWDSITSFTESCALYSFKVFGTDIFVGGAICLFNGDSNYDMLARFDGSQWNIVPEFTNLDASGIIHDMEIYNGQLYVCGNFNDATSNFNGVAKYDGANWSSLGLGLETNIYPVGYSLEEHNGLLYVGGRFSQTSTVTNQQISAWDGFSWSTVPPVLGNYVRRLVSVDTSLIASGPGLFGFQNNFAHLQAGQWITIGSLSETSLRTFARVNGELYTISPANNNFENEIYTYHNGSWELLPLTTRESFTYGDIVEYDDRLLALSASYSCGSTLDRMAVLCDTIECGVISGRVYVDDNLNCVDDLESAIPASVVQITPLNQNVSIDSTGHYRRLIPPGNYDVNVQTPQWYNPYCPSTVQSVTVLQGNSASSTDFSIEAVPNIQDLEITATALNARIGQLTTIYVTATNVGTSPLDAIVNISHNGLINYDSSNVVLMATGTNQLEWNIGNLDVYESKTAKIYFTTPQDISLLGQVFQTSFVGSLSSGVDANPTNNMDSTYQFLIAAYDPNKKTVSPVGDTTNNNLGLIPASTQAFEYTIYFQNTGLDTAINVVLIDTIHSVLDVSSFTFLSSSHSVQTSIIGSNMIKFSFANILLPDSTTNLLGSQGFVKFKIKPANPLVIGDQIMNKADIYFDLNPPIETNYVVNTVSGITSVEEVKPNDVEIIAYPNPFSTSIRFKIKGIDKQVETQFYLYDLSGKLLKKLDFKGETSISLKRDQLSAGFYVVRVISDGVLIETKKIIIE